MNAMCVNSDRIPKAKVFSAATRLAAVTDCYLCSPVLTCLQIT